jgi:hypothetical protein
MKHTICCGRLLLVFLGVLCVFVVNSLADDPCRSGLRPGQRPGPYAFVLSTGPNRGKSHCYICETADRPAVAVFAHTLSAPLGRLARQLDRALPEHKKADLRAWITVLNDDQPGCDTKVVKWSDQHGLRHLPLGVFEDAGGPPSYRLNRDADVTVLFFVKQKVVSNFAFRAGELTDDKVDEVLKALPQILEEKK